MSAFGGKADSASARELRFDLVSVTNLIDSRIQDSSFADLLTLVEIGQIPSALLEASKKFLPNLKI